ncbi:MAG: glycosyltransferase [Bacteroidota bacterium]
MLLSVIIPVYNVQDYISKCIESVSKLKFSVDEYEILAINDGATDNSPKILDESLTTYSNLKIITQENQGLSGARNTGIKNAKGEYIIFVDADDILVSSEIGALIDKCVNKNLDILEFGAEGVMEDGKIVYQAIGSTNGEVLNGESYLHSIKYMGSACNKIYKTSFLRKHSLLFMPRVYIEDIEFNTRAVYFAERVLAVETVGAQFLQRQGSITRSSNYNKVKKMIYDIFKVLKSINHFNETVIGKESKAYIPMKRRVSSLIATMLLRAFKEVPDDTIAKDILIQLKQEKLYPAKFKADDSKKQLFLSFANKEWFFLNATKLVTNLKR